MILEEFSYIAVPQRTGVLLEDVRRLLKENGCPKTLWHVENVASCCIQIARKYELDEDVCQTAGLLHDVGAVIRRSDMQEYALRHGMELCEAERRYPFLLHQRLAQVISEEYFGIIDQRILSAVACHTTLKSHASEEDMALFLADKLAWDQEGIPPYRDQVQEALEHSLEEACLSYMRYTESSGRMLYPHVQWTEALNWLEREG